MKNYCVKTWPLRYFSSKRPASRGLEPWTLLNEFLYFKLQYITMQWMWHSGRTHCGSCDHEVMGSNDAFSFFISLSFSLQEATKLTMNKRSFWKLIRLLTICATTNFELHFLPVPSKPSSINPFLIDTSSENFSSESRWLRDRKIATSVTFTWELKY